MKTSAKVVGSIPSISIEERDYINWLVLRKNILPINLREYMLDDNLIQEFSLLNNYVKHTLSKFYNSKITLSQASGFVLQPFDFKLNGTMDLYKHLLAYSAVNGASLNKNVMISIVKDYVKVRTDLNVPDTEGITPLMLCIDAKNINLFFALAEHGVDINALDPSGFPPLHKIFAYIENGEMSIEVLKEWVKAGYKIDVEDRFGFTVFNHAIASKKEIAPEIFKILSGGIKTESETTESVLDLSKSVATVMLSTVTLSTVTLRGFDKKSHDFDTKSPPVSLIASVSAKEKDDVTLEVVGTPGLRETKSPDKELAPLQLASGSSLISSSSSSSFSSASFSLNQQNYIKWLAVRKNILLTGDLEKDQEHIINDNLIQEFNFLNNYVKYVIKYTSTLHGSGLKVNVSRSSEFVLRPFNFKFTESDHGEAVDVYEQLIPYIALKGTSLSKNIMDSIVKDYVKVRTDLDAPNSEGFTPLMICMMSKNMNLFFVLAEHGADINALDPTGFPPIHRIFSRIENGEMSIEVLKELVKAGCKIDVKDRSGFTVFDHALSSTTKLASDMFKILLGGIKTESETTEPVLDLSKSVAVSGYDKKGHDFDTKSPPVSLIASVSAKEKDDVTLEVVGAPGLRETKSPDKELAPLQLASGSSLISSSAFSSPSKIDDVETTGSSSVESEDGVS